MKKGTKVTIHNVGILIQQLTSKLRLQLFLQVSVTTKHLHGMMLDITDDAHPGDFEESMAEIEGVGALVPYVPSEASSECYNKGTKADRWCTLNEDTLSY